VPVSEAFADHARELLAGLGPLRTKRMFGGVGVWCDDMMFALLADDDLYIKTDETNRAEFEAAGSEPFMITMRGRAESTGYWRIPVEASEDPEQALRWARLGLDAALRKRKPTSKARSPSAADLGPGPWTQD
jgi:DNA transformation protein